MPVLMSSLNVFRHPGRSIAPRAMGASAGGSGRSLSGLRSGGSSSLCAASHSTPAGSINL